MPHWRQRLAESGRRRFETLGLPSTRAEAWRHFPTRALGHFRLDAPPTEAPGIDRQRVDALALPATAGRAVFVNGVFAPGLSELDALQDAGLIATNLATASQTHPERVGDLLGTVAVSAAEGLLAANDAFFSDGFCLLVPANVVVDAPIEVLMLGEPAGGEQAWHPRHLIALERCAEATLVVRYVGHGEAPYATNAVTEIALADNAKLRHIKVCAEGQGGVHVASIDARLAADAGLDSFVLTMGGERARTALRVELAGKGAECSLDGLYVAADKQRLDHYTEVDHLAPHTSSSELHAGIMADTSIGNFQGIVRIHEGASRCETHQLNRNLLLSQGAVANTKPQLEIDNDDVSATHGATVGQLDDAALFYLLSRGIEPDAARGMLTFAFARDALARVGVGVIEDVLIADVAAKLGAEVPST